MADSAPTLAAPLDLQAASLRAGYLSGWLRVADVVDAVLAAIASRGDDGVWIHLAPRADLLRRAAELDELLAAVLADQRRGDPADQPPAALPPLFGLPFAVKDNIDVAGMPTTAACPRFGYPAAADAFLVERLLAAGAVCVGKTNLDQFATGLSGVRSPYGIPSSPFDPAMISGGSSSGSAVAVAAGLVTFAIGTDTAGSGRVPAALTNTVGLKPSRGLVSARGVVPACRSLDCPSVSALSVADATLVLSVIAGFDEHDPWSRRFPPPGSWRPAAAAPPGPAGRPPRLGVPPASLLAADCAPPVLGVFDTARDLLVAAGAEVVEVDLDPFLAAGRLLYDGPWLAERYSAIGPFLQEHPDEVHPVIAELLAPATRISGVEVFTAIDRLRGLRRQTEPTWREIDALLLPTVPRTYSIAEMLADPIRRNARLGRFTTFVNLLDLAAVSVPAGFADNLPYGVTLVGPAGTDAQLAALATDLHTATRTAPGLGIHPLAAPPGTPADTLAAAAPPAASG
ncbi:MAG: allophanate hydrolase [Frankia sp.]|nr:allophanate hydrolase [Frankia sp.]